MFNEAPRLEITKEMRKLGWDVDLIASGPAGKHTVQGVEVLLYPTLDMYFLRHLIFHLHVIRYILWHWKQIDIVMLHQISALWILPLRLLFVLNKRRPLFVLDSRTVTMEAIERATGREKLRKIFFSLMNTLANYFADGQTTITKRMADLLCVPKEKLWGIWPSGVNIDKFSVAVSKRRWPVEQDPLTIIYIGSLHFGRNLMTLCRAVDEAHRQGMNMELVLYGEGTEKEDLQAFAKRLNGCIKVYDAIPHDQIPDVLACAHVGALPFPDEDKYRVSSPIKLFEYMGSGIPILATKISCHTDVIGDGAYTFWAYDSSLDGLMDAVRKVWQARSSLSALGKQASIAARDWAYSTSARKLSTALQYGLSLPSRLQKMNINR
jgi:glycosyltransferase involved in cell wall biosynthesis